MPEGSLALLHATITSQPSKLTKSTNWPARSSRIRNTNFTIAEASRDLSFNICNIPINTVSACCWSQLPGEAMVQCQWRSCGKNDMLAGIGSPLNSVKKLREQNHLYVYVWLKVRVKCLENSGPFDRFQDN